MLCEAKERYEFGGPSNVTGVGRAGPDDEIVEII